MTIYSFDIQSVQNTAFPNLDPVCCSMSDSNYCFLTCIQISQKAGKVVSYSYFFFLTIYHLFIIIIIFYFIILYWFCHTSTWIFHGCTRVPHGGFDLHFSDNEWCWASFHVFVKQATPAAQFQKNKRPNQKTSQRTK